MQGVVLAAGTGTRIMPLTETIPKALLPIANRPILEYVLDSLERAGLKEIVVVTGHLGRKLEEFLKVSLDHGDADVRPVNAIDYGRGPIFSLLAAENHVTDDFVLAPVDLILAPRILARLLSSRVEEDTAYIAVRDRDQGMGGTPVTYYQPPADDLGSVVAFGPSGARRDSMMKGKVAVGTSVGVTVCPRKIFDYAHAAARNGSTRVVDALNLFFSENGKGRCVKIGDEDYCFDVDTVEMALSANRYILQNSLIGDKPRGKLFPDQLALWSSDESPDSSHSIARIIGPSIIGRSCEIGVGSSLGPFVSVQDDCVIGTNVTCTNSIITGGSRINAGSTIRDAITIDHEIISTGSHRGTNPHRDGKN
ncbi:MAG: NDP-sugar synthase [Promethearchaeati archaeon SRVP18_Atabeyarchaeia-1]